jgi:hypothetical protein
MVRLDVEFVRLGALARFGAEHESVMDFMSNQIAESFKEHLIRTQMSGQTLARRTGETAGSVRQYRDKRKGAWAVRPGVGVRGGLNYLQGPHFEGGARPFTKRGVRSFNTSGEASRIATRIYNAMMKRIFKEVA